MPTQIVNLTPELDRFVKTAVEKGEFKDVSEVHRAALLALARERKEQEALQNQLLKEIQLGLDSGPSRKIEDLDAFLDDCLTEALKEMPPEK